MNFQLYVQLQWQIKRQGINFLKYPLRGRSEFFALEAYEYEIEQKVEKQYQQKKPVRLRFASLLNALHFF